MANDLILWEPNKLSPTQYKFDDTEIINATNKNIINFKLVLYNLLRSLIMSRGEFNGGTREEDKSSYEKTVRGNENLRDGMDGGPVKEPNKEKSQESECDGSCGCTDGNCKCHHK
jgi:hypothetical protein